jgi:hypothetical protein
MTQQSRTAGLIERRIIAAEVALIEHLPGIARFFLSRVDRDELVASTTATRGRFVRALRASRITAT